jgi:hypothetical protein
MPRRSFPHHHSRVRFTAIAVVICGHAALFALLAETTDRDGRDPDDARRLHLRQAQGARRPVRRDVGAGCARRLEVTG